MMGERCIECILIEVCPDNLASLKSSPEELFSIADSYGYDFFTLTNDGTPGRRLTARDLRQITIDNVLLMPRRKFTQGQDHQGAGTARSASRANGRRSTSRSATSRSSRS
jgi:hypothetical protein